MRILWLTPNVLLPLDKGGKLRTWHLMRHLAARHEITCLCFANPDESDANIRGMSAVASRVVTIPRREATKDGVSFYISAARHLFDRLPYAVAQYRSRDFQSAVARELDNGLYDCLVCDFLVPAVNLPAQLPCPAVLFTHNVEAEIWRRHAATASGRVRRWLYGGQWTRMRRFEGQVLRRFDHILAVSETDRDTLERLYPLARAVPISVIPTGVDTDYFVPGDHTVAAPPNLVFTGSMDWLPNVDGVRYFCRDILPRIREVSPGTTFSIVGRAPTAEVRRLAEWPGVEVTGRVDDIRPFLDRATVYVVPLRIGGGTRLKIFEAMSAGKAVVSTTVGAEGLPVENGRHVLLADTPETFATAVVDLVRNATTRHALEHSARALVRERYDWSAAATHLERALLQTRTPASSASSTPLTSLTGVQHS